jgi:hypothetical protein
MLVESAAAAGLTGGCWESGSSEDQGLSPSAKGAKTLEAGPNLRIPRVPETARAHGRAVRYPVVAAACALPPDGQALLRYAYFITDPPAIPACR